MTKDYSGNNKQTVETIFAGGGEMGARMRALDWSQTPLGAVETWEQSLITAVRLMLNSRFSMFIWWGEKLVYLYNDAYLPTLGIHHPQALGRSAFDVWSEIWRDVEPQVKMVVERGEATWNEELLLFLERSGFKEETYHTFSYSPIIDENDKVGGLFCAVSEDTQKVLNRRRLQTLRDLGERTMAEAKTVGDACRTAAEVLSENPFDLPFAAIYLLAADGSRARLVENIRLDGNEIAAPREIEIDQANDIWEFERVLGEERGRRIANIEQKFGRLSAGAWDDDHAREAFIVPLAKTGTHDFPAGFLVAGISPRLAFDAEYQGFLELVAGHIATSITNAEALEAERRRVEALAELDRAKTEFFSNVSHEFRTPLTLMLGNLEEVLRKDEALPESEREQIETAHRNSLRLLKLVNNLLDFSRIEAGKAAAHFEATDLARFTAELASGFRAGIEKAGIKLKVACPPLSEPVAIDREMWEKIVLNLLSNAFKFTLRGEIEISLGETAHEVELKVRDTGVGIPADELPNIFERFHRVRAVQGRTHEGTGIGLSLVQELVRLHRGTIEAASEPGAGTVFTVKIPKTGGSADAREETVENLDVLPGFAVKPPEHLQSYLLDSADEKAFETIEDPADPARSPLNPSARILLADDNADMRAYIARLLRQNGYAVETVEDGQAALDKIRTAEDGLPDLVLTDVMMPRLDGFELLGEIRKSERTREIPFIMLSARAGEESKIEGFESGADDYLIKPFSARELLARVNSVIELSKMRRAVEAERKQFTENLRQSETHLQMTTEAAQIGTWEWHIQINEIIWSPIHKRLWGYEPTPEPITIEDWARRIDESDLVEAQAAINKCLRREGDYDIEYRITPVGSDEIRWIRSTGKAVFDQRGKAVSMLGVSFDVTEAKQAEELLQKSEAEFRLLANAVPQIVWVADSEGRLVYVNEQWTEFSGLTVADTSERARASEILHPDDRALIYAEWKRALESGTTFEVEARMRDYQTGEFRWFLMRSEPTRDAAGKIVKWFGTSTDITANKSAEKRAMMVAEINQLTRQFENPASLLYVVSKVVGEYFKVTRCLFNEIFLENDLEIVHRDFCDGVESVAGRHKISDYSAITTAEMSAGKTVVNRDSKTDPRTAAVYEKIYAKNGERAYVAVPLLRENRWVASLWVSDDEPRDWTKDDVNLLEIVAEQVWSVVEKLRIDAALRESEKRFRNMADHAPVMVWVTDPTGFCTYLSQSWYEFTGQTPETGLGFGWLDATHPDDAKHAEEEFVRANQNQSPFRLEYRLRGKDGEYRWAIDSAQPRFGEDREYLGYIGSVIDITERKAAEQEREKLLLQEKFLREEAENANRLKDEFLATVSHELRTPLNSMLGWATMVRQNNFDTDLMRRAFEIVERNARNQNQIISDILDVSRIITGKLNLNLQPVDLSTAILAAIDTVRPAIDAKGIDLVTRFEIDTETVTGDADRLQQIVWNLLSNAVKFTPEGGTIEIVLGFQNNYAEISVSDNGSGISPEFLPFVFDRFRQADGKMNRRYGGLGLGLAIARHLTELHGGSISAHSPGAEQGSTFTVRFPLKMRFSGFAENGAGNVVPDRETISTPGEPAQKLLDKLKILVVDDEPDALELVAFILTEQNALVSAADSVDKAIELFETQKFDAIVSDIGMPEKDGFELMRLLKSRTNDSKSPVPTIALTAYAREQDSRRVLSAGFSAYLPKPVEPATLIETVIEITRNDGD
jgi:PAS domain S-box-containing protein